MTKRKSNKKTSEPGIGFGAAENADQDEFDRGQAQMSKQQLQAQVDALVKLFWENEAKRQK